LGRETHAVLAIFDVAGRRVRTLVHARQTPGDHAVVWDGRDEAGREVGTGIYMYRLTAADGSTTKNGIEFLARTPVAVKRWCGHSRIVLRISDSGS
jgi:flagellar hook assembly protein FlgD